MKERGFTLIEFFIVAAILGILAATAIPAFYKYHCKKSGECKATYKSYQLNNGKVVRCNMVYKSEGTVNLEVCEDGNEYKAQTNVIELKGDSNGSGTTKGF